MDYLVSANNFVELWVSECYATSRCISCRIFVDIIYNYSDVTQSRDLQKGVQEVNLKIDEGALIMGIHYDYKSTRGDKAMKKEAKRKARIEQRRAKRSINNTKVSDKQLMHDIDKPITLEDLTNPDKN